MNPALIATVVALAVLIIIALALSRLIKRGPRLRIRNAEIIDFSRQALAMRVSWRVDIENSSAGEIFLRCSRVAAEGPVAVQATLGRGPDHQQPGQLGAGGLDLNSGGQVLAVGEVRTAQMNDIDIESRRPLDDFSHLIISVSTRDPANRDAIPESRNDTCRQFFDVISLPLPG